MRITSAAASMMHYGYAIRDMTIGHLVRHKAEKNGHKVFMTFMSDGRTFTYEDMNVISDRIANGLRDLGVRRHDHVAVLMENSPEQVLLYFALGKLGAVAVPINTSARGKLLTYFITHSDSRFIVSDAEFVARVDAVLPDLSDIGGVVILEQESEPTAAISPHGIAVTTLRVLMEAGNTPLDQAAFSDLAMLVYTSGTTGPSKANMLPHAAVVQYGMTTAESHGYRFDDIVYISLPLNHANAYLCSLWGAFVVDASVAVSARFSVSRYWSEVKASGATVTNLLGSMSNMLWGRPETTSDADNKMRMCNLIPVPKFAHEWERRFGTRIISSYGQTDYASSTVFTLADPAHKLGSSGRPRSGIEVGIVDDDDLMVDPGVVGELVLRSNNPWSMSQGYYKNAEATVANWRNGWWHTGDAASIDRDGFVWFAERKKDAIRRRGENISAYEVEGILVDHPDVQDAAVFAVKSELSEEEVAAVVVLKPDRLVGEEELLRYCVTNMAHYMVPRFIRLADDLPRTSNQKVQKEVLKRHATEDIAAFWDRDAHGITVNRR